MRHRLPTRFALAALLVLLLAACTGQGSTTSPASAGPYAPQFVVTVPPVPADVQSEAPACPGNAPVQIYNQAGLYSACAAERGRAENIIDVYNLSDSVLDVTPTYPGSTTPALFVTVDVQPPVPDTVVPSADTLVEETQNQVVSYAQQKAKLFTHLVPVGGSVTLTSRLPAMNAAVGVDTAASEDSYAAQLLSGYVIDNLLEEFSDSTLAYTNDIADCVNNAAALWGSLRTDQTNVQIAATINNAFQAQQSCNELQEKLAADPNEAAHVLADLPKLREDTPDDLAKVLGESADSNWKEDLAKAAEDIAHDVHDG